MLCSNNLQLAVPMHTIDSVANKVVDTPLPSLLVVPIDKRKKDNKLHVTVGTRTSRTDIVAKHLDEDTDTSGRPNITLWRSRRVEARTREFCRQCMSAWTVCVQASKQ